MHITFYDMKTPISYKIKFSFTNLNIIIRANYFSKFFRLLDRCSILVAFLKPYKYTIWQVGQIHRQPVLSCPSKIDKFKTKKNDS